MNRVEMAQKYFLAVACLLIPDCARPQNQFNQGILNPDLIYFNDGGQRYPANVLPLDSKPDVLRNVNREPVNQQNLNAGQIQNSNQKQTAISNNNFASNPITQNNNFEKSGLPQRNNLFNIGVPQNNFGNNGVLPQNNFGNNNFGNFNGAQRPVSNADRYSGEDLRLGNGVGQGVNNSVLESADPVSLAVSNFGINLMKSTLGQQGNLVLSPFSIATLLALLQQGSLGTTQLQISEALQLTPNQAADGFKKLSESMRKRPPSNILKVANGIFAAEGFNLNPAYKRSAINDFGSEVASMKFSRPHIASQKINNWVASNTNNKIDKLLQPESVDDSTQLVLVNAVYFKGLWAVKFKPEATIPKEFHLSTGGKKPVAYMRMRRYFRTDIDPSISSQILILPFENEQYSLTLILPFETTTLASALSSLTKENLLLYQTFTPKEVALEVPKFTVKSDTNLVSVFQKMGITNMFGPRAELNGIGSYREFSPQVSSALHSALLSIDEEGGVAAAATSFGVVALSYDDPSIIFRANRPFLAIVWDNLASVPLFIARIEEPVL